MIPRSLAIAAVLLFTMSLFAGGSGTSCAVTTPEIDGALDALHASIEAKTPDASLAGKYFDTVSMRLAAETVAEEAWLHVGVDLGRELVRLGRNDDARMLFKRIVQLDGGGTWGKKAAEHLRSLK